jgi:hypothetical protein
MFKYYCVSCSAAAFKKPVEKYDVLHKTGGGLGTWHCDGKCKGKVKVKRERVNVK